MKKYHFVYLTTNLINGKIYVGQHSTNKIDDGYLGSGKYLLKAIKKYGKENFKRVVLNFCSDQKVLNRCEGFWIKELNSTTSIGYNISLYVGDIFKINPQDPRINGKWSQEVKDKMKETWRKKKENGEDLGKRLRGIKKPIGFGEEVSKRMQGDNNPSRKYGAPNKGVPWSEEVKAKISKIHKENKKFIGKGNPRFIPISEKVFNDIIIDLENGYGGVKELSNYYNITEQRIYRHLFYNGVIFFDDLPKYLKNRVVT